MSDTKFVARPVFAGGERPKSPKPQPHSEKNPTIGGLFSATDRSKWVDHRIPKIEKTLKVMFEPIYLNKQKYEPGRVYHVPPEIDAELAAAEDRFVDSIGRQINGNDSNNKSVADEVAQQAAFDLKRRAQIAATASV